MELGAVSGTDRQAGRLQIASYSGFAEPKGTAVICLGCNGAGVEHFSYIPFVKRKPKKGIDIVKRSAGTFILTGVGPKGNSITYKEFEAGKLLSQALEEEINENFDLIYSLLSIAYDKSTVFHIRKNLL